MTWVRYDDNVANHHKVAALDDATYRLWREAIEWCAHNTTDGVILTQQLTITSVRATKPRAARLVAAGLWHRAGDPCISKTCPPQGPSGWVIHDYWDYQPTREKVRAEQAAKAERQRRWIDKKRGGHLDADGDASRGGSKDGAPAPPRPAPKEAGAGLPRTTPAADGGAASAGVEESNPVANCRTCAHALTSAYHRNACREEPAA